MWFDTHCHFLGLEQDLSESLDSAAGQDVTRFMSIACEEKDWLSNLAVAGKSTAIWASAGVHPHAASEGLDGLEQVLGEEKIVAVGECGLDYYYEHSDREAQREVFAKQIHLAYKHELALIIHTRDAWDDTFAILDSEGVPPRTLIHCFSGGVEEAEQCLQRGTYISFSGIVTFPSAKNVQEAAGIVPADRILVETDAPYLAPVPHRGRKNIPAHVSVVGEFVASLRAIDSEKFAAQTTENANKVFGLS